MNALGHRKRMVALASNTAKAFPRLKGLTCFPAKRLRLGNLWVITEADRSVTAFFVRILEISRIEGKRERI